MDTFQTRQTDSWQTVTPRQAIARVQELATAVYGPLGAINFEFIPLPDEPSGKPNWDLVFRPSPSDAEGPNALRSTAIQRAIDQVKAAYPKVRWP